MRQYNLLTNHLSRKSRTKPIAALLATGLTIAPIATMQASAVTQTVAQSDSSEMSIRAKGNWQSKHLITRSESLFTKIDSYEEYRKAIRGFHGFYQKHLGEHIAGSSSAEFANRYAKEYPHKTAINHFSVRGVNITSIPELWKNLYPGHFLQGDKQSLSAIKKKTKNRFEIKLPNPKALLLYDAKVYEEVDYIYVGLFPKDDRAPGGYNQAMAQFGKIPIVESQIPETITLEILGEQIAERDLKNYDLAPIMNKGTRREPRNIDFLLYDYREIDEVVSQIDSMQTVLGNFFDYEFNDPNGRLNNFDGLGTDGFRQNQVPWQQLNLTDSEAAQAEKDWDEGAHSFLKAIREALGPDRILMIDSISPDNHYSWTTQYTNFETEGLTNNHDHHFRSWGTAFNIHQYQEYVDDGQTSISEYINTVIVKFPKLSNEMFGIKEIGQLSDSQWQEYRQFYRERLTLPYAAAMIIGSDFGVGNQMRVILDNPSTHSRPTELRPKGGGRNWLGKFVTDPQALVDSGEELLADDFMPKVETLADSKAGVIRSDEGSHVVSASGSEGLDTENAVKLKNIPLPKGDSVLVFKIKADEISLAPDEARWVTVSPATEQGFKYFDYTYGKADANGFNNFRIYIRNHPGGKLDINLAVEGSSGFEFKDFSLKAGPDVWYRDYKHGVVLANPSNDPITLDLKDLGIKGKFRNLKANRWDSLLKDRYDGSRVGSEIELPPLSGVFLQRKKSKK